MGFLGGTRGKEPTCQCKRQVWESGDQETEAPVRHKASRINSHPCDPDIKPRTPPQIQLLLTALLARIG